MAFKPPGSVLASEQIQNPSRVRAELCLGILTLGFAAVIVKLFVIQVLNHEFWTEYVNEQRKSAITIYPKRGAIYDRTGTLLAASVEKYALCVVPSRVTNAAALASALSPYARMPADKIIEKITTTALYLVYLRRGIDMETKQKIETLNLKGVEFRSESARAYPKGSLASNLIGFSNVENRGLEGIEYKFNSELAGEAGREIVIKDNYRREIVALATTTKEVKDGNHVVLTIDENIQYSTEDALEGIMEAHSPECASAVVIAPKSGEVLAMACRPTFDPNKPSTYASKRLRNRAVTDVFEPGSAFKPIAAAAALAWGVITPWDRVYCEHGSMRYHGHTFHDVHPLGEVAFADVIAESSNIGMIKVVSLLQPQILHNYIRYFGFGATTGIDLPGESAGIVHPPSRWSGLSMGSIPIGQEIGVTAVQLAQAYAAIANDGVLMRPRVISSVLGPDGAILRQTHPQPVRTVMSEEVARNLTTMLERVVTSGTGVNARIKGYRVAGKTGTAQKPDLESGGYYRNKYVAIFAGFVPADDPVAAIVVVVDSPQGKYYGSQVAAPAFRKIAHGILNYLEIPPSVFPEPESPETIPQPLTVAARSTKKKKQAVEHTDGVPRMPDVQGMTMTAIVKALSVYSPEFEFTGSGVAIRQNPAPGETIVAGRKCGITFERRDLL